MTQKKGFLVTFEGGDGCGKSTQLKLFEEYLKSKKIKYLLSREPGGTPLGEDVRKILLNSDYPISSRAEFLLFSASRTALVEEVVKPALERGEVVVLDRFYDSSYTYQGYAGNLNVEDVKNITEFAINGTKPNLTFLLDLSFDDAMKRKTGDEKLSHLDRIEQKGKAYHDKVREGYLKIAEENTERVVVVDASKSAEDISKFIVKTFEKRYKEFQKANGADEKSTNSVFSRVKKYFEKMKNSIKKDQD